MTGLSYYTCVFLVRRPLCLYQKFWPRSRSRNLSVGTKIFDLVTLTFDLLLRKLNLRHNFKWIQRDKIFISCMDILCGKTFLTVPKFLIPWPWPPTLTYFWKNLTLALTFEPKEIGLSYYACVFLWANLSVCTKMFIPWPPTLTYIWINT